MKRQGQSGEGVRRGEEADRLVVLAGGLGVLAKDGVVGVEGLQELLGKAGVRGWEDGGGRGGAEVVAEAGPALQSFGEQLLDLFFASFFSEFEGGVGGLPFAQF